MYCSVSDVYAIAGITSDEVSEATVTTLIEDIETDIDRLTNTTYWNSEENGTATSATNTTLVDSTKAFTVDLYIGDYLWVTGGTGSGQFRIITDNDATSVTVDTWTTNPDDTSTYRIIHTGTDPRKDEDRDGDGTDSLFIRKYPLVILDSVTIDDTDVTISYIHQYKDEGELKLGKSAEKSKWDSSEPLNNNIVYKYGVYPLPGYIKSYATVLAGMAILSAQMGGTHNIPSTYSLPEGSVTIGQAYINIKGTFDVLSKREQNLKKQLAKYPFFA